LPQLLAQHARLDIMALPGGFLARDWHRGAVAHLAAHSFKLHAELATELGAEAIG
jgi:hypothetical protein